MFTFARFATLLKEYTIMTNEDIVNLLLGCIYKTQRIKNKKGDSFYFDKVECSRLINGEKNLPAEIMRGAGSDTVCEVANYYFYQNVCSQIIPSRKCDLIEELRKEIQKDQTISLVKRKKLLEFASEENLSFFLSDLFLYVVAKNNKLLPPGKEEANANQQYANGFTRPLFFHTEKNDKVTLEKLFIWQNYSNDGIVRDSLKKGLSRFVSADNGNLMIIEGSAGTGKSTLVQCINHHYRLQDDIAKEILGKRKLVTVRLRDFSKDIREELQEVPLLLKGMMKYLDISKMELEQSYGDTLYILDGLDELCTSESRINANELISEMLKELITYDAKFFILTRPNYVVSKRIEYSYSMISLCPYNSQQRKEWIKTYEDECGETIPKYLHMYLEQIGEEESIFNVPLNLYMLVARKPDPDKLKNTWSLYHDILYKDIRDTLASKQTAKGEELSGVAHPDATNWEIYYRICEEIAYEMYISGNEKLWVNSEDIQKIIQRIGLVEKEKIEGTQYPNVAKKEKDIEKIDAFFSELETCCHALCGFWKSNPGSGVFEFFHNDIRDFFLCEKVYREILSGVENTIEKTARVFSKLFAYGRLEIKVLDFLNMRSEDYMKEGSKALKSRLEKIEDIMKGYYPKVLQVLITDDSIYKGKTNCSLYTKIASTVKCIWEVMISCNLPLIKEGDYIMLYTDAAEVNKVGILKHLFMEEAENLFLPWANLSNLDLSHAYLVGADLRNSNLAQTNLQNADLHNSDLGATNLSTADLSYANLTNVRLNHAKLENAIWNHARLYGVEPWIRKNIQNETMYIYENRNGSKIKQLDEKLYPGDLLEFGSYWQKGYTNEGKKPEKTPILWRILEIDDKEEKALLLADQILDCQIYNEHSKYTSWAECTLSTKLNGSEHYSEKDGEKSFFAEAFNEEEQIRILAIDVQPDETEHTRIGSMEQGERTVKQKIFLLSKEEVMKYFASDRTNEVRNEIELGGMQATAIATDFAKEKNANQLTVDKRNGTSDWWLRSMGPYVSNATFVSHSGSINIRGRSVSNKSTGVRPALWISLKKN